MSDLHITPASGCVNPAVPEKFPGLNYLLQHRDELGINYAEIARRAKCSASYVSHRARELGLSPTTLSPWTEEKVFQLEFLLLTTTLSYAGIAAQLGLTKNQVIGRVFRTNPPGSERLSRKPFHPYKPLRNPFPAPGCCLYPYGHPGKPGFRFCGAPATARFGRRVYCAPHVAIVYAPAPGAYGHVDDVRDYGPAA